ncbi:Regulator of G protein signaling superfamily [Niveomyces insectorum RCEF 264]|uniref:Regulator of G protein signaling superfamily n=1 Tax=Niveomyces insectorum RCEF 264 TaxID=1081102 RepID=A0A162IH76_9HYPO|nr:Regulator of G protein signaling superfamily [Niveomyces insectorum RCEF 264]
MWFPSWLNWYKKPEYRDIKEYSNAVVSGRRPMSPDGRSKVSIPSRLRLERVLENKTCSPMSLYDFYMYLKYIEYSPENLEFYIWYRNYQENWKRAVAGEKDNASFDSSTESTSSLTGDDKTPAEQYSTDPEVAETLARITEMISSQAMCAGDTCKPTFDLPKAPAPKTTNKLNRAVSTLNFVDGSEGRRAELNAVIKTFLRPGAEKELNIPPAMRDSALAALSQSSDPVHLKPIADHVYLLLRNCSHRNFVRLGVSNGTFETICVATSLGIALTVAGVLCVLLRAFTPHIGAHSRYDVFAAWPMWWLGLSLILSGLRGSCFFLLLFTRRQPLPWERFDDNASVMSQRSGIVRAISRLMIFDRKLRVKDAHLRRLQHRIVMQSLVFGAFFSCVGSFNSEA